MKKLLLLATSLFLVLLVLPVTLAAQTSVNVTSGHVYYLDLVTDFSSLNWAGLKIVNDATPLSDSTTPFTTISIADPVIVEASFPGYNLKDDAHYYMATLSPTFNLLNVSNVTDTDLNDDVLFRNEEFPNWYQGSYDDYSDNPYETFCCTKANVTLAGENYTAFVVQLAVNISYYVLKYNTASGVTPLFLVDFQDYVCYNSSSCVSEFMLPTTNVDDYSFYILPKSASYDYDVWIDDVETTTFAETGLPYNLTVRVRNLLTNLPVTNITVAIAEDRGQSIFIPYTLDGYISESYSSTPVDADGFATFIVAPTEYPSISNYTLYLAVIDGENRVSRSELQITDSDALTPDSKTFIPARLQDNIVANVNAMNQIVSFLYTWSSQLTQALVYRIEYNVGTNTFTTYDLQISNFVSNPIILKTGAPNVITLNILNAPLDDNNYTGRIKQQGGYLLLNPYTDYSPLNGTERVHMQTVPVDTQFIITPTELGFVDANITFDVIGPGGVVLGSMNMTINASLNIDSSGTSFDDDLLKTIVNAMNQIVNNLYNTLN